MLARIRSSAVIRPDSIGTFKSVRKQYPTARLELARQTGGHSHAEARIQAAMTSSIRLEKPHSLSYHERTLTKLPGSTLVSEASSEDDAGLWLKSIETRGSSLYAKTPFSGPSAAARTAALTSSAFVSRPGHETQVHHRNVDGRNTDGESVQAAIEFRQHKADRPRRAGRGRNHRLRGRTGPAQVAVRHVRQHLIVGIRMGWWS